MKLFSQYLKNIMLNFPIGHDTFNQAEAQLKEVLRCERECDEPTLVRIIESWGQDPIYWGVNPDSDPFEPY